MAELSLDFILTIFSKLPMKSLMRFKCMSKQWCRIISRDTWLAAMHMNNLNRKDLHVLLLFRRGKPGLIKHGEDKMKQVFKVDLSCLRKGNYSKKDYYNLQGLCNGLLFLTKNFNDGEVVFYNPITREVAEFKCRKPPSLSPTLRVNYGFGYDFLSKKYKLVRIFRRDRPDKSGRFINLGAEVSSLEGGDNSWRKIQNFPAPPILSRAVFAGGAIHWVSTDESSWKPNIVSFLVGKEEFTSMSAPECISFSLIEVEGSVGIIDQSSPDKVVIWVKRDLSGKWIRAYKIDIEAPVNMPDNTMTKFIGSWEYGQVLMKYYTPSFFVLYNRVNDRFRFIEIPGLKHDTDVITHRGSLVSVSGFRLSSGY